MSNLCPCCSSKKYHDCCQPLHEGVFPENALALMRSRYSAYALCLPDYIMRTTHPDHNDSQLKKNEWKAKILDFSKGTQFHRLDILEFIDGSEVAYVKFIAHLSQDNQPMQLHEKSLFLKIGPQWLYRDATFFD